MELLVRQGDLVFSAPDHEIFISRLKHSEEPLPPNIARHLVGPVQDVRLLKSKVVPFIDRLWTSLNPNYPTWHVLDIGAYIGSVGLAIADWARSHGISDRIRVDLFEPSETAENISRSIIWNDLQASIVLHKNAVSDSNGYATYFAAGGYRIGGRLDAFRGGTAVSDVSTVRLDDVVADLQRPDLYFLKIDTEGHECEVLRGSKDLIDGTPNILALEFRTRLIGKELFGKTYEDFLWSRYEIWDVKHIDYPHAFTHVPSGDRELLCTVAHRAGRHCTDLLCIDKRIDTMPLQDVLKSGGV